MFALFAGDRYYPGGGWNDFVGTFDSIEAAHDRYVKGPYAEDEPDEDGYVAVYKYGWGHVVDLYSANVVVHYS